MSSPKPFKIDVPESVLSSIKSKLADTRFPHELELPGDSAWEYGTPLQEIKSLATYWSTSFDWRAIEARLNASLPQFTCSVTAAGRESIQMHFVHVKSTRPGAIPLLFSHGWPGNFTEVSKILPLLTDPADPSAQAYHIVAPSLPGFVFSSAPRLPGFDIYAIAGTLNQLMLDLGYDTYIAQGGDWGSFISRALAIDYPAHCRAIHMNMFVTPPPSKWNPFEAIKYLSGIYYTPREIQDLQDTQGFLDKGTGYQAIQGSKPQTLNVALTDSPVGMLAWITEKLHAWSDHYPWTMDEILTWVMLYYVNAQPATHIYKENVKRRGALVRAHIQVPVGVSVFPKEIYKVPKSWAQKMSNVIFWKTHDHGGHFAATETPEVLVADIQEFVAKLKDNKAWLQKAKF